MYRYHVLESVAMHQCVPELLNRQCYMDVDRSLAMNRGVNANALPNMAMLTFSP